MQEIIENAIQIVKLNKNYSQYKIDLLRETFTGWALVRELTKYGEELEESTYIIQDKEDS